LDVYESGTHDSKEIAARLWANPRQISKSLKNIQQLQSTHQRMKQFFRGLVELDWGIKTWKYPDTYFWLGIKQLLNVEPPPLRA
jgi:hypothetical protein